jgi:hypothetical protein
MNHFNISWRRFHLLCAPLTTFLQEACLTHNADYRTHKFGAWQHLLLTIFAQLDHSESANALVEELNDLECAGRERNLREMIGFNQLEFGQPVSLNQSSFSRANRERSYRLWRYCFHQLYHQAKGRLQPQQLEGLGRVVAVDGTFLDCLTKMAWAVYRTTTNKLKGHFFFDLDGLPEKLVLTTGKGSEREILETHFRPAITYLIDRGYNSYELFRQMLKAQAHFVTRLLDGAIVTVRETHLVSEDQASRGIVSDQTVQLGQQDNTVIVRLVVYQNARGEKWSYITSRMDLEPYLIVELYGLRWEIETFFWWIKTHLQIRHWYSLNENGVLIQLYAALITFVLLKSFTTIPSQARFVGMRIDFIRWIKRHLFDPIEEAEIEAYLQELQLPTTVLQT